MQHGCSFFVKFDSMEHNSKGAITPIGEFQTVYTILNGARNHVSVHLSGTSPQYQSWVCVACCDKLSETDDLITYTLQADETNGPYIFEMSANTPASWKMCFKTEQPCSVVIYSPGSTKPLNSEIASLGEYTKTSDSSFAYRSVTRGVVFLDVHTGLPYDNPIRIFKIRDQS